MGTDNPMSKRDDYTAYAAELLDLASRVASTSDKGRLLAIAEGLVELRGAIVVLRAPIPSSRTSRPMLRVIEGGLSTT
jgi:hypothetical protein